MKKLLLFLLKVIVSIGSLYFVFHSISFKDVGEILKNVQYSIMSAALILFLIAQFFSSLRYVFIARVLGGTLDIQTSLKAHFVGLWFNQVMPTSLGGDIIKMAILKKKLGLSIAIRSAILDRVSGLMFLLLATAFALPLYDKLFPSNPKLTIILGILSVGCGLVIILGAWFANYLSKITLLSAIVFKYIQILFDIWAFRKNNYLWGQFWTSAIVHFNGVITLALLAVSLGVTVDPLTFLLVVPVIFLIALFPISFAGWGVREVGAVWMFGMVGISSENAVAISVCFGLLLVLAGLPGLLIFIIKTLSSTADKQHVA